MLIKLGYQRAHSAFEETWASDCVFREVSNKIQQEFFAVDYSVEMRSSKK